MTFGYLHITCLSSGVRSSVNPFGNTNITHGLVSSGGPRLAKTSLNVLTKFNRVPTVRVYNSGEDGEPHDFELPTDRMRTRSQG